MIVIGLTGYARAGKDSVADILVRDYGFTKLSFAAPLKEMLRKLNPIITGTLKTRGEDGYLSIGTGEFSLAYLLEEYTEDEIKQMFPEYRRLLQKLGTECIRSIDDDFWINAARNSLTDPGGKYVFTDVRFPNEAQMIYDLGVGTSYGMMDEPATTDVWQVTRPGVELPDGAHISEQWAGKMGEIVEIRNDGTLEALKGPVGTAMDFLHAPVRWLSGAGEPFTGPGYEAHPGHDHEDCCK